MPRKIYCAKCGFYLGEIRDAKLRKGTVFICVKCAKPIEYDMPDFLKGIIKGR
jgi:hypothetical protein